MVTPWRNYGKVYFVVIGSSRMEILPNQFSGAPLSDVILRADEFLYDVVKVVIAMRGYLVFSH